MRPLTTSLCTLAVIATLSAAAVADDRSDSDKIFKEGLSAYGHKDFEGARTKFAAAYARYPSPNSLFNLARVEQVLGRNLEAYRHYRAYSELPENPRITPPERAEAKQRMGESLAKLGRIVLVAPQGARVVIDGAPQDNTSESFPVEPGSHSVDFVINDQTRKRSIVCQAGEVHQVKWDNDAREALPIVTATPAPVTAGSAMAPRAATDTPRTEPDDSPNSLLKAGLIVGGVGALGILGGVTFGMLSSGSASDARAAAAPGVCVDRASAACTSAQSSVDSANTFHTVSMASFITGGVLLAGGGALVALGVMHKSESARTSRVVPVVLPGGLALGVVGSF
jgi:hypothetical protein